MRLEMKSGTKKETSNFSLKGWINFKIGVYFTGWKIYWEQLGYNFFPDSFFQLLACLGDVTFALAGVDRGIGKLLVG